MISDPICPFVGLHPLPVMNLMWTNSRLLEQRKAFNQLRWLVVLVVFAVNRLDWDSQHSVLPLNTPGPPTIPVRWWSNTNPGLSHSDLHQKREVRRLLASLDPLTGHLSNTCKEFKFDLINKWGLAPFKQAGHVRVRGYEVFFSVLKFCLFWNVWSNQTSYGRLGK